MSPELSDLEHSLNFPAVFFSSTLSYPHLLHSGRSAADHEIGLSVDCLFALCKILFVFLFNSIWLSL